ncbi:hypothetical protein BKG82_26385 [Mycobacteroides chelonae]|uniref:Uncharacterized protein n=1 Tax=Mycobacteroides chelonae TaxID=1774 RepID=A0A1S1LHK8_MYCCH|nr:hypothetical protein BKG82_26385 [Mycobacteroides chelonae]
MTAAATGYTADLSSVVRVLRTAHDIALLSWRPKGLNDFRCADTEDVAEVLQIVDDAMPGFDVYHCATRAWESCGQPVAIAEVNRALRAAVPGGALLEYNDAPGRAARDIADLFMRAAQMVSDLLEVPRVPSAAASHRRGGGSELGHGGLPSRFRPAMGVPSLAAVRRVGGSQSGRGSSTSQDPAATARPSRVRRGLVLAVSPVEGAGETATQTGAPPSYPPNPFGAGWRSLPNLMTQEGA